MREVKRFDSCISVCTMPECIDSSLLLGSQIRDSGFVGTMHLGDPFAGMTMIIPDSLLNDLALIFYTSKVVPVMSVTQTCAIQGPVILGFDVVGKPLPTPGLYFVYVFHNRKAVGLTTYKKY